VEGRQFSLKIKILHLKNGAFSVTM